MIWLYRILFIPFLLLASPYYIRRMIKRGGYTMDFHHRLGFVNIPTAKEKSTRRIWIQAVSVGEVKAIGPLLEKLNEDPNIEIVLTTTTTTGYELAQQLYANITLSISLFPADFLPFSLLAWKRIQPDLALLMESELWPEHLQQAKNNHVPVILINARLSDRSFKRYLKFQTLAQSLLKRLTHIATSNIQDHERLLSLGAEKNSTTLTGNLKLDVPPPPSLSTQERTELKLSLGFPSDSFVLLGSSTWPGEELILIDLLHILLKKEIDARLLIVPRHAERRYEIKDLLKKQKLSWHLRTSQEAIPQNCKIYVADTTGELTKLSQLADIAFIGKSFYPNSGGQTPVEAAGLGIPILFGADMSNFRHIAKNLEKSGAALRCENFELLKEKTLFLHEHENVRKHMGESGKTWHQANRGATAKTLQIIQRYLTK